MFHLVRDDVNSPWFVIGVYFTGINYARCKYHPDYAENKRTFDKAVRKVNNRLITGSREFLEQYRAGKQSPCDVISPIVSLYALSKRKQIKCLSTLAKRVIGSCNPRVFDRLAVMFTLKRAWFPCVADHNLEQALAALQATRELNG
jgi:hypothetical protein